MRAACILYFVMASSLITVVPPTTRLTKRIVFLVDVSGSMAGLKFDRACGAVLEIAGQPVDEMEMAVFAFDNTPTRWPGIPEPRDLEQGIKGIPKGWAALPSQVAMNKSSRWLSGISPDGGTLVIPALLAALAEERKELSIVLITDGQFYQERTDTILAAVETAQRAREAKGLGRAVILAYGVAGESTALQKLAEVGGGGFYKRSVPTSPLMFMKKTAAISGGGGVR